jgi:uncharacterized protein YcbK (DUF882 family)
MTAVKLKLGASIAGLQPEMAVALVVVSGVYERLGVSEVVITSGTDGIHSPKSRHYLGFALDFRTRNVPLAQRDELAKQIKKALGQDFFVLLESDHLHIDFRPRRPE